MSRSNGVVEESAKEAKKLIGANISPAGIIDKQSMVAGLMMFRNTPRKPINMSPAQLVFCRDIRDSLPMTRASLKPAHRFVVELQSQNVRKLQKKERVMELELLQPGQKVFVQHPTTKKWTRSPPLSSSWQMTASTLSRMMTTGSLTGETGIPSDPKQ
jgi:hypothetical protein